VSRETRTDGATVCSIFFTKCSVGWAARLIDALSITSGPESTIVSLYIRFESHVNLRLTC